MGNTRSASQDTFGTRRSIDTRGGAVDLFDLRELEREGVADVSRLPYSIRILLENLLRYEDGEAVTADDIRSLANWDPEVGEDREIAFQDHQWTDRGDVVSVFRRLNRPGEEWRRLANNSRASTSCGERTSARCSSRRARASEKARRTRARSSGKGASEPSRMVSLEPRCDENASTCSNWEANVR